MAARKDRGQSASSPSSAALGRGVSVAVSWICSIVLPPRVRSGSGRPAGGRPTPDLRRTLFVTKVGQAAAFRAASRGMLSRPCSPESAQRPPQHRPGLARATAQEDIRVVPGLLVYDTVPIGNVACRVTYLEEALRIVASEAQHDQALRGRIAVAAQPVGVDPADRRGQ